MLASAVGICFATYDGAATGGYLYSLSTFRIIVLAQLMVSDYGKYVRDAPRWL